MCRGGGGDRYVQGVEGEIFMRMCEKSSLFPPNIYRSHSICKLLMTVYWCSIAVLLLRFINHNYCVEIPRNLLTDVIFISKRKGDTFGVFQGDNY